MIGRGKAAMKLLTRLTTACGKSAMTSWTEIGRGKAAMKLLTKLTTACGNSAMTSWTEIDRGEAAITGVGRATIGTTRVPSMTIGIESVSRRSGCRGILSESLISCGNFTAGIGGIERRSRRKICGDSRSLDENYVREQSNVSHSTTKIIDVEVKMLLEVV